MRHYFPFKIFLGPVAPFFLLIILRRKIGEVFLAGMWGDIENFGLHDVKMDIRKV